jgi:predicted DNA-binding transcriptional regulator AlpA
MKHNTSTLAALIDSTSRDSDVATCPFVNEPMAPWHDILTSREVARLIRRPKWFLYSLTFIGRFPRRRRFRGRTSGWLRSEIHAWISPHPLEFGKLSIGSVTEGSIQRSTGAGKSQFSPLQRCLPFDCARTCRQADPFQIHGYLRCRSRGTRARETRIAKRSAAGSHGGHS